MKGSAVNLDSAAEKPDESTPRPSGRRKTARNVASMLATNIVRRATMFVIYVLVARYLGTYHFGQLALASTLLYSWHKIALVGLQTLITRDVARKHELAATYAVHASAVGLFTSGLGIALLVPFVQLMDYSADTREVIYLAFIGLAPLVLSQICEGVLQGRERMDLIAYVNIPISLLKVGAVVGSIHMALGIRGVIVSLTAMQFAVMISQWLVLAWWKGLPPIAFSIRTATMMIRSSSVFLGIQAVRAINDSVIVAVLSKLNGEASVGVYAAASQLLAPLALLITSISYALLPAMCRGYDKSSGELLHMVRRVIEGLLIIALPAVVGLFLLADAILMLLYGDKQFLASAEVLRIIVWTLLVQTLTSIIGQLLYASSRERLSLRIVVINTVVQCITGIILISGFGVIGAAISALLTSVINLIQHLIPTADLDFGKGLVAAASKPAIASVVMSVFVVCGRGSNLAVNIACGATVYFVVLAGLFVWSAGGLTQFRTMCASAWTPGSFKA